MFFPTRRRAWWPFVVVAVIIFLMIKFQLSDGSSNLSDSDSNARAAHHPAQKPKANSGPAVAADDTDAVKFLRSQRLREFWDELFESLTDGDIGVEELGISDDGVSTEYVDPNSNYGGERVRENHLNISDEQIISMRNHYISFASKIEPLASRMPYWKNTRGVVMPGGGKYTRIALSSILLLRHVGCKLPIQVFIDNHSEYNPHICENTFARLGVECVVFQDLIGDTRIGTYQYKVLSIIFSPFQHVLFLDADAWPLADPAFLFDTEPYKSNGLITFPDFWVSTASPAFFNITGTPMNSPMERRSSESGILLYNKEIHADSLILASYFNFYGPGLYYKLLTQGTHGEGDKETYLHAALNLGKPFYDVKEQNSILGRHIRGNFQGSGMVQHDPNDDWKLQEHIRAKGEPKKTKDDKIVKAKPLFIHHNLWKIDLYDLGNDLSPIHDLNDQGKLSRMWGDQKELFGRIGYDAEEMMFRVLVSSKCRVTTPREECRRLWKYCQTIFKPATR